MAVYIANLGKYNEGYLVGAWFTFPIDEEDVKEKIGLNEQYEEYAIHDTDNFPIAIGEYVSIEELNEMYEMIEELPDYIVECLIDCIQDFFHVPDTRIRFNLFQVLSAPFKIEKDSHVSDCSHKEKYAVSSNNACR